jgi:hypothetical protein
MKKKITIITLAFALGLLCCDLVSAQLGVPGGSRFLRPDMLPKLQLTPQAQNRPQIDPAMINRALNSPVDRDAVRRFNPGATLRDTPDLSGFNLRPVDPIPQGVLDLPPGTEIRPIDPPGPGIPHGEPQPMPIPQSGGPTLQFGPGGPSVSFGNGPTINIPVGQIVDRIRDRRGFQSPTRVTGYGPNGEIHTGHTNIQGSAFTPGRNLGQLGETQQVQQPVYDHNGNVIGFQSGSTWQNPITGQQHGNVTTYTPNGTGGMHQSTTMYSTAGGNITPRGN